MNTIVNILEDNAQVLILSCFFGVLIAVAFGFKDPADNNSFDERNNYE